MTEKTLLSDLADELEAIPGWQYRLRNETEDVARTVLAFLVQRGLLKGEA